MKNIVLENTILQELISNEQQEASSQLWQQIAAKKHLFWVSSFQLAQWLPNLASASSQEQQNWQQLLQQVQVLSCHGFSIKKSFCASNPQKNMLLELTSATLGDDWIIVSNDEQLFTDKDPRIVSLTTFLQGNLLKQASEDSEQMLPFIDLAQQQQVIREKIEQRIQGVLRHGKYVMGPEIAELEQQLSQYVGVKHTISCASGTDALLLALMAYDVKAGDVIFTSPFTFIATAEVISLLGAKAVFVDISPDTFNIDPEKLKEAIAAEKARGEGLLRGIIPVDLFGLPADYDAINEIARAHNLFVIEDAAQSLGGEFKGKPVGSLADMAATSFFPAKPLGCYGDGGAIFTDDDQLAEKLRSLRVHGQGRNKYENVRIGINGRLDALQAAVLLSKLEIFPQEIAARQQNAQYYSQHLQDFLTTPYVPEGYLSAWAQYSVLSEHREACQEALKAQGIPSVIYYPIPLHLQQAFAELGYQKGDFPVSEASAEKIFSLPMHPYLAKNDMDRIITCLQQTISQQIAHKK